MTTLELLKSRLEVAKAWTKEHQEEIERNISDYEVEESSEERLMMAVDPKKRYEFKIPYIFATHESMLSSMFDRIPDLVINKRYDETKRDKITAVYDYLVDRLDLESFMTESAWWFILTGFVTAHGGYRQEYQEIPVYDEFGQPQVDENGEPLTRIEYTYDDPEIKVGVPSKEYFSPESEFSNDASRVPYYFREELLDTAEIKRVFDKDVKADSEVGVDGLDVKHKTDDIKRSKVYFYYGTIPEENKEDFEGWEYGKDCYAVLTKDKMLYSEVIDKKKCTIGKWHGRPDTFFGFGIGKTLRQVQIELSLRRGQQMRYADIAAFPKLAVDMTTEFDQNAILDPRAVPTLLYKEKPPEYLSAPDLSNALLVTEDKARQDAQFISGMLDLSKGAQDSQVVKTATGQTIFAEAAEKRMKQMKRQFSRFYFATVIMLLELARDNWSGEKVMSITGEDGKAKEIIATGDDLKDIDFYRDVDIDMESISVNKEALRAQSIELYNVMKDDPNIDRAQVAQKTLRDGFNEKRPEKYIVQSNMPGDPALGTGQPTGTAPMVNSGITGANNATRV